MAAEPEQDTANHEFAWTVETKGETGVLPDRHGQLEAPLPAVPDAPALASDPHAEDFLSGSQGGAQGAVESFTGHPRRAPEKRTRRRRPPAAHILIFVLGGLLAGLLIWRTEVVRIAPQTASLFRAIGLAVNVRGLAFDQVRTRTDLQDGVTVLIVEGMITNIGRRLTEVPRLRFALRNAAGHEVYAWTLPPPQNLLGPGDAAAFRTQLASPPSDGREVIVRFLHRNDVIAGMR
jgi:hypothetical protein